MEGTFKCDYILVFLLFLPCPYSGGPRWRPLLAETTGADSPKISVTQPSPQPVIIPARVLRIRGIPRHFHVFPACAAVVSVAARRRGAFVAKTQWDYGGGVLLVSP